MPVILIIRPKDGPVSTLSVSSKPLILGRSSSCTLKLADDQVSGKHIAIKLSASGEVLVKDLETTNGSFINGRPLQQERLYIGDQVKIGDTTISIDPSELNAKEKRALTREPGTSIGLEFVELEPETDPSITPRPKPKPSSKPNLPKSPKEEVQPRMSQTDDTVHVQTPKNLPKIKNAPSIQEMDLEAEIDLDQLRNLPEMAELSEEEQTLLEEKIKRRVLEKSRTVNNRSRRDVGAKLGKDDSEYDLENSSGATKMIKIDRKKVQKRPKTRKEMKETKIESLSTKLKGLFSRNKTRDEGQEDED